jgi:hypothetical protein
VSTSTLIALHTPPGYQIDPDLLLRFEAGLDPRHSERNGIPARVLGYGEISTVFEIEAPGLAGLAFKRLPIFNTAQEMARYSATYDTYLRLLTDEIGLVLPAQGYAAFLDGAGCPIFYIMQQQLPAESIGSRVIHVLNRDGVLALVQRALGELIKVWQYNARQKRIQVGIDGQISNWAILACEPADYGPADWPGPLVYLDTSTPLFRVEGREQLDTELFLRSAPSFLRWLLRLLFVKDVVARYYDLRLVAVDLIANFYKEGLPGYIPSLIAAANTFLTGQGAVPIGEEEVRAYYRQDATIWRAYLAARKLDRTLQTRLLRRRYPYILPPAIRR